MLCSAKAQFLSLFNGDKFPYPLVWKPFEVHKERLIFFYIYGYSLHSFARALKPLFMLPDLLSGSTLGLLLCGIKPRG